MSLLQLKTINKDLSQALNTRFRQGKWKNDDLALEKSLEFNLL